MSLSTTTEGRPGGGLRGLSPTLDPLTYPFSRYEGIGVATETHTDAPTGRRLHRCRWRSRRRDPEKGVIFGQEVSDLAEWAAIAANSEAFRRATVSDYWEMVLGELHGYEQAEFGELRLGPSEYDHRIEKMLHDLIETEFYGAPESRVLALSAVLLVSCKDAEQPNKSTKARVLAKPGPVWGRDRQCPGSAGMGTVRGTRCIGPHRGCPPITLAESSPRTGHRPATHRRPGQCAHRRRSGRGCGMRRAAGPGRADLQSSSAGPEKDDARARREVAQNLVRRILARHPNETEVSGLWPRTTRSLPTDDPTREWSIGACMVVATSTEVFFY